MRKVQVDPADLWLLPLLAICFFINLGGVPLFDLDEGAFSSASWEMLARHDYITTYLNGVPRFDKPILVYWFQAASMALFGFTEFAARLPSALFASGWLIAVYYFIKPRWSAGMAQVAAIILASSFAVMVIGRAATADALLNFLIVLTMLDMWRFYECVADFHGEIKVHARFILLRVFFWMALGFLCKGPVAILVPSVVSGLFFISHGQWRAWLAAVFNPIGIALFFIVAAPWYVLEYQAQGMDFINGFFFKHNIERLSSTMEGHGGHSWYYLALLPAIALPFSLLLLKLFVQPLRPVRNHQGVGAERSLYQHSDIHAASLLHYLWIWFAFVFVFFSFSNTQLPHYLLYGFTPIALLLAKTAGSRPNRFWLMLSVATFIVILYFVPDILTRVAANDPKPFNIALARTALSVFDDHYKTLLIGSAVLLLLITFVPKIPARSRFALLAMLHAALLLYVLLPRIALVHQSGVKAAAQYASAHLAGKRIVSVGIDMPSFTYYRQAVTPKQAPQIGDYVYTKVGNPEITAPRYSVVFTQNGIVIAQRVQ